MSRAALRLAPLCVLITALVLVALVAGCEGDGPAVVSAPASTPSATEVCGRKGAARAICGFTNPEDMVPLPGDRALLIGEYGQSADDHSGGLVVFDLASESKTVVFRGGEVPATAEAGWGAPDCTTAPGEGFNSHGIDLVRRDDGRLALLVVQHGSREAVEFFEVRETGTGWQVDWRGCVPSPPDASLNEVAALSDGSFFTTKMASIAGAADLSGGFPEGPTGTAFYWSAEGGFVVVAGTAGVMPNGIAASPDGRTIYMNASGENSIRKVDVARGVEVGRAVVSSPDNVTWSPDGRLLVASLRGIDDPELFEECLAASDRPCPIPFAIVAVDPESMMNLGVVYESDGQPMGAGTVGLQVGDELFVGSFKGDRILRIALGDG